MENKEPSPVKLINRRCLEIKLYNWLICGKRAGKENLRRLGEKGMQWCDMDLMLYNFIIDFCSMTKLYLVMSCHYGLTCTLIAPFLYFDYFLLWMTCFLLHCNWYLWRKNCTVAWEKCDSMEWLFNYHFCLSNLILHWVIF